MTLEDINRYRPARVALENPIIAKSALEKLVETANLGEGGPNFIEALTDNPDGVKYVANTLGKKFQDTLMGADLAELFEFYKSDFNEYLDEASYEVAKGVFGEYAGKNYESVYKQFTDAQTMFSTKNRKLSEDEEKKYLDIIEKYGKIVVPIQKFEAFKKAKISEPLDEKSFKKQMAEMFKPAERGNVLQGNFESNGSQEQLANVA